MALRRSGPGGPSLVRSLHYLAAPNRGLIGANRGLIGANRGLIRGKQKQKQKFKNDIFGHHWTLKTILNFCLGPPPPPPGGPGGGSGLQCS